MISLDPVTPDFDPLNLAAEHDVAQSESAIECWRCGKQSPASSPRCPYCRATIGSALGVENDNLHPSSPAVRERQPLVSMLMAYACILAVSVVMYVAMLATGEAVNDDDGWQKLGWMIAAELLDIALIVWFLLRIAPPPAGTRIPATRKLTAWGLGLAGLVVMLGLNLGYHALLNSYLQIRPEQFVGTPITHANLWAVCFAMCLQPGIVEETFFRYLCYGWLRTSMGMHAAVWVSAVMFGSLHIFVPLSIPMLVVTGAFLGYLRVWSGGVALPIVAHILHNAVVIAIEGTF